MFKPTGIRNVITQLVVPALFFAVFQVYATRTCSAQQATVTVPGTTQIALAGAINGTTTPAGDTAPLNAPVQVNLPIAAGQAIQIGAMGLVGYNGAKPNTTPDGGNNSDNTQTGTGIGIGRITGPETALIGVFTGDTLDLRNIPPDVYYTGDAVNIPVVAPMLQQPFMAGTGVTADGTTKTWIAPAGATRLYLGVLGYYMRANTGSFTATVSLVSTPTVPSNPVRVSGVAQIALAGAMNGTTTPAGDTAPLNAPVQVNMPITAGQAIQISAAGLVGYNGRTPSATPNGGTSSDNTQTGTGIGIGRITGPETALVGVFTGDTLDLRNIPPDVYYTGDAANIPVVAPMLQQPFMVGTGVTADGTTKTWIAPAGATRLYLGVLGYYMRENTGSFLATVSLVSTPTVPSNPVRVSGVAQIALAGAMNGTTTPAGDTAPLNAPATVQVPLIAGQALRFTTWGIVGYNGRTPNTTPDGGTSSDNTQTGTGIGIGRITGPETALVGVFTSDTVDLRNVPSAVDYSSASARDISNLTPLLQQPFFVGTGRISTGDLRRVIVPPGVTHLYLGVLGYYMRENTGTYVAVVSPDAPDTPALSSGGVLNAAGFGPSPLASGSVAAVFGSNLATQTQSAASVPLPNSISGTRAYLDLLPAPLYFVSSGQVNLQVPFELNVQQARLTLARNGSASLPVLLNFTPYGPGIFVGGDGSPIIVNYRTGGLISASQPVRPGDVLIIYATGLGRVANSPASGTPTPFDKLYPTAVSVTVALGSQSVSPDFAGLAPGFIGVYQVNVTVPALPSGQTALQLKIGGASSNSVPVYIGP